MRTEIAVVSLCVCLVGFILISAVGCEPANEAGDPDGSVDAATGERGTDAGNHSDSGSDASDAGDATSHTDAQAASDAGDAASYTDARALSDAGDASFHADGGTALDAGDASLGAALYACGSPSPTTPDGGAVEGGSIPLLSLGHTYPISSVFQSEDRVLAFDGFWILWDTLTGNQVASASDGTPLALAGSLFIVQGGSELELRAVSDGTLQGTIPLGSYNHFGLASDGSYVWGVSSTNLTAWSPTGTQLSDRVGNYSASSVFASPSELRIALGPAGSNVIEYMEVPSATDSVSAAFSGTFDAWFLDGSAFLTNVGTTVWIYGEGVNQLEIIALPSEPTCSASAPCGLGGEGNYFWTFVTLGADLTVYPVGGGSTPVAQYSFTDATMFPMPGMIGILQNGFASVDLIQLGATVTHASVPVISAYNTVFAADRGGRWSVGNQVGVLSYVGTTSDPSATGPLGCGQAFAVAGSDAGMAAVATASGYVLIFDTASRTLTQEITNFSSAHLALSGDGTVLAATDGSYGYQYMPHGDLNIYSLPEVSLINGFSASDFRLSRNGTRIGIPTSSGGQVSDLSGTTIDLLGGTAGYVPAPRLSPSGTYVAMSNLVQSPSSTTLLFNGSTLVNAVPGYAVGWIDDNDLLVQTYVTRSPSGVGYSQSTIYNNAGVVVASPALMPEVGDFYVVSPSQIFSVSDLNIYDVITGAIVWNGESLRSLCLPAALAGSFVVCASSGGVFLTPY